MLSVCVIGVLKYYFLLVKFYNSFINPPLLPNMRIGSEERKKCPGVRRRSLDSGVHVVTCLLSSRHYSGSSPSAQLGVCPCANPPSTPTLLSSHSSLSCSAQSSPLLFALPSLSPLLSSLKIKKWLHIVYCKHTWKVILSCYIVICDVFLLRNKELK